ncbi:MAG: Txe/YoeB family addiction module toxin [Gallionella sp.]|nr:Txe/YoeB family addiction module toxin [Gallionella sp.]OIO10424.1 MAG: addiction module protein [Gallionellaceae bacterium CG1_02_60_325]PIR09126.1 MAG: Txe/YoeB family addiction module toxin [Gallionellaceae bacterium CG11_big_fil_rev_8_21_14_0_20_60_62]PIV47515.1 MAG: Txe/YoeB family addiction module toxin [Gallionellaceae bacterium CG02_land_8_20_14_3_00_60_115]PIY06351.1 MAG: Txe/YoeB family addiction module toxin [Gallionellaceae bacterium CG_4_10_14_3_um_filter_60_1069]
MMRAIRFVPDAWESYLYWQEQDRKTLKRINLLIDGAVRDPFDGVGKPEPLRGDLSGYWSRRTDGVNRLVYRASDEELVIIACRFHYSA